MIDVVRRDLAHRPWEIVQSPRQKVLESAQAEGVGLTLGQGDELEDFLEFILSSFVKVFY